jgi:hypothetical protein
MNNVENIKDKIDKLLRLQKGAEEIGSIEEAANAAQKIQAILMKYNLDLSDIKDKEENPIFTNYVNLGDIGWSKIESKWMISLITVISRHNFCKAIFFDRTETFEIIGTETNVKVVEYFISQMINKIKTLRVHAYRQRVKEFPDLKKNSYYRSYSTAFTAEIAVKFRQKEAELKQEYLGATSLMVVNNEAIETYVKQKYTYIFQKSNKTNLKNKVGAIDGLRDGRNAQLNEGLN